MRTSDEAKFTGSRRHRALQAMLALVLLGVWAPGALAREYIVDAGAAQASDSSEGTSDHPLRSIGRAAELARAGDTVRVRPGVYRETVHLKESGKPGEPITFEADPSGQAIVSGADPITDWQRVPGKLPIYRTPWQHIFAINYENGKPIEFHPEDAPLWGRAEQVIVDGRQLMPTPSMAQLQSSAQTAIDRKLKPGEPSWLAPPLPHLGPSFGGLFFADTINKWLYVWLVDGSAPQQHDVQAATRSQTFGVNPWENKDGVSNIRVRGFVFQYGASFPQRAVVWLHGHDNLVEDCVIEDMAGAGVAVGGTLRHCLVRGCGQTGGAAGGDNFLNEDCVWEDNCWKPINRGWDAGGVKMALVHGGVFRRCIFRHNGGPGLWFDIDCRNITIQNCIFAENEGSGLFIEISRDFTVTHNLAYGNGIAVVGNAGKDDWSTGGIQLGESQNCTVVFNTCVGNKDGITFREQGPRPLETKDLGTIPYHDTGEVVVGNICAYNKGYQLGIWSDNGFFGRHPADFKRYATEEAFSEHLKSIPDKVYDPLKMGWVIDRNLYFALPGESVALFGVPWRARHKAFDKLADFTAFTGFDTHSIVEDPLFDYPSGSSEGGTFGYRAGSPAITLDVGWRSVPTSEEMLVSPVPGFGRGILH